MAASKVSSSLAWVTNMDKLISVLDENFVTKASLMECIAENCVEPVLNGIIQMRYWKRKLEPQLDKRTVILACLGPSGLIKPDICELFKFVETKVGKENILSVYYSENEKFTGFNFVSAGAADKARQAVAELGEALICYIYPGPVNEYEVRVLWAPAFTPLDSICQLFDKYALNINLSFETVNVKLGHHLPSNIVYGKITLKEGISVSEIPHIARLPSSNNRYVLIIIRNRAPLCLKCRLVGHYRRQCNYIHCSNCKTTHNKELSCKGQSYASAVSNTTQAICSPGEELKAVFIPAPGKLGFEAPDLHIETSLPIAASYLASSISVIPKLVTSRRGGKRSLSPSTSMYNSNTNTHVSSSRFTVLQDEMDFVHLSDVSPISLSNFTPSSPTKVSSNITYKERKRTRNSHSLQEPEKADVNFSTGSINRSSSRIFRDILSEESSHLDLITLGEQNTTLYDPTDALDPGESSTKLATEENCESIEVSVHNSSCEKSDCQDEEVDCNSSGDVSETSDEEGISSIFPGILDCACKSYIDIPTEPLDGEDFKCNDCSIIFRYNSNIRQFIQQCKDFKT